MQIHLWEDIFWVHSPGISLDMVDPCPLFHTGARNPAYGE